MVIEIADWLPQLIMFLLVTMSAVKPRPELGETLWYFIGNLIFLGLLLWGKFFDKLIIYVKFLLT